MVLLLVSNIIKHFVEIKKIKLIYERKSFTTRYEDDYGTLAQCFGISVFSAVHEWVEIAETERKNTTKA